MNQGALKKKLPRTSFSSHSHITKDSTVQNHHQNNYGAAEAGAPLVEKDFASLKTTTEVPPSSFEFYVWSDEGINLHVNLNSSPSDWTKRFKKEVCITENLHANESWSFWQDLGCLGESSTQRKSSFLQNTNPSQIEIRRRQTKSLPSLRLTKDDVTGLDQQDKGDSSLISDTLKPLSMPGNVADKLKDNQTIVSAELTANMADNLKEGQSTVSAVLSYGAPNNFMSGAESCAKNASKEILDSDAAGTPFSKSLCGSVGNSLSDHGKLERQNSKPGNEISEDFTMLNGSCFVNPGVVRPGVSVSSSVELQISEVASCHKYASVSVCENDGTLDLIDPKNISDTEQGGLVNSSFNVDTDGNNFLSLTEEWV